MTTITVNTKSNYKNCNGQQLEVVHFLGTIISAKVPEFGFDANGQAQGKMITSDFNLKEVVKINQ